MARIAINHEDLEFYSKEVADPNGFIEGHEGNIEKFRSIAEEEFKDIKGRFVFDYIVKYHQFDLRAHPENLDKDILEEKIKNIEKQYPDCFVSTL